MAQDVVIFVERMARQEEADGVELPGEALDRPPGLDRGEVQLGLRLGAEQVALPLLAVLGEAVGGGENPVGVLPKGGASQIEFVEGAGGGQGLDGALVDDRDVQAAGEIGKAGEAPAGGAGLADVDGHRPAHVLESRERIADRPAAGDEILLRLVDRGRLDGDADAPGLAHELAQLVGVAHVERHRGGQELDRMIGLEIGGLICEQRIGGGVRLVEAVAGELGDQLENVFSASLVYAVGHRAVDEPRLLLVHLGFDLLAHGAAQQIGLAQGVARERLGDLHHLFLINDDAVGLLQDRADERMQIVGLLLSVLAVDEGLDVIHRSRAVERHHGDDVLEAVGLEHAQAVAHARSFELEHADGLGPREQRVGLRVVERQAGGIDLDAASGDQLDRPLDDGKRLEAEKIELHQPRRLGPFHVELGRGELRARVAVEGHEVDQRAVADDDARGVGRGVPVKPLEPLADVEQARHDGLTVARLLKPRLAGDRLGERGGIGRVVGHQLAQAVDLAVGHLQDPAHVAQHGARLELSEGDDLGHPVGAVGLLHVADHLVAPLLTEIDVEIRHGDALGIEEPLEQQAEAHGIEIGDGERPGDQRAGARAAARSHGDPLPLRPFDEVGDDQEIARIIHVGDDAELVIEARLVGLLVDALGRTSLLEASGKPGAGLAAQLLSLVLRRAADRFGQDRLMGPGPEGAALGDLDGAVDRVGQVGEQARHGAGVLEVMLGAQMAALVARNVASLGDADERVVSLEIARLGEEGVVGGDHRECRFAGKRQQMRLDRLLLLQPVALQLDIEAVAEEVGERLEAAGGGLALAPGKGGVDRPLGAAGERDETRVIAGQIVKKDMGFHGVVMLEISHAREPHQVAVSLLVLGEEGDGSGVHAVGMDAVDAAARAAGALIVGEGDGEAAANDRLDARLVQGLGEFQRAEQVVGVGERERGHARLGRELDQLGNLERALKQRIGRAHPQMHEKPVRCRLFPRHRALPAARWAALAPGPIHSSTAAAAPRRLRRRSVRLARFAPRPQYSGPRSTHPPAPLPPTAPPPAATPGPCGAPRRDCGWR